MVSCKYVLLYRLRIEVASFQVSVIIYLFVVDVNFILLYYIKLKTLSTPNMQRGGPVDLRNYMPAKQAAEEIGISYSLLTSRMYNGKIKYKKVGWAVYIPKGEVARMKKLEEEQRRSDASDKGVEGAAR